VRGRFRKKRKGNLRWEKKGTVPCASHGKNGRKGCSDSYVCRAKKKKKKVSPRKKEGGHCKRGPSIVFAGKPGFLYLRQGRKRRGSEKRIAGASTRKKKRKGGITPVPKKWHYYRAFKKARQRGGEAIYINSSHETWEREREGGRG